MKIKKTQPFEKNQTQSEISGPTAMVNSLNQIKLRLHYRTIRGFLFLENLK